MHLEGLTADEVLELNIPTGQPRVYELDDRMGLVNWRYLDAASAAAAADAVSKQAG
jgi:2,3-bisphosphoglycerate-dependent phosphoglycerate mutase